MIKINNIEYEISYSDLKIPKIKITQEIPKTLSKYYALNNNNINAFLNRQFYVSQPENLNDLFDSFIELIDISNIKFETWKVLLKNDTEEEQQNLASFQNNKTEFLNGIRNALYLLWHSNFGILCMTNNKYNDLMWAHYTNNSGFLIEFDITKFNNNIFTGPYPINYLPKLETIDFNKSDKNLAFMVVGLMKKEIWKYENEYRFFCRPDIKNNLKFTGNLTNTDKGFDLQDRLISYPSESIKKVILAFNFFKGEKIKYQEENIQEVSLIGNDCTLKMCLLNNIISEKIIVELCEIDKKDFSYKSVPIEIVHKEGTTYKITIHNEI
jgi:hypothetical protein